MSTPSAERSVGPPFDTCKLDALMHERDLDILLVSSKHALQYMLGGHRSFFYDAMDAIGVSRYLPILVYPRGRPDRIAFVGSAMEAGERELGRLWPGTVSTSAWGTQDAMAAAIRHIDSLGYASPRIGIEAAFLPADAYVALASRFGAPAIVDALVVLERLRLIKTPHELSLLRAASERVVESMLTVIANHGPGTCKDALATAMAAEVRARGLAFDYCLVTAGTSLNRAPSPQRWESGAIASLDSGANLQGYIGDVCRMAILGEPDAELEDLLGEVQTVQDAARRTVRPGVLGRDVISAGAAAVARSPSAAQMHFVAHGMGIVSHEGPRLTAHGPVPYPADDADAPLEAGMVLSVETTLPHPRRGFIKLEDTIAVTAAGSEGFGDAGRGWNRGGTAPV